MLFRKKIERCCAYCTHAGRINDDEMICSKRGVVASADHCHAFRYDPLKRVPSRPKPQTFEKFTADDFKL